MMNGIILVSTLSVLFVAKGDYFFRPDRVCGKLGFIREGLLRSYVSKAGKDYNVEFYAEGQFVAAFTSFLTQKPSDWAIQALEDCQILTHSSSITPKTLPKTCLLARAGQKHF